MTNPNQDQRQRNQFNHANARQSKWQEHFFNLAWKVMFGVMYFASCAFTFKFFFELIDADQFTNPALLLGAQVGFGILGLFTADWGTGIWLWVAMTKVTTTAQKVIAYVMVLATGVAMIITTTLAVLNDMTTLWLVSPTTIDTMTVVVAVLVIAQILGYGGMYYASLDAAMNRMYTESIIKDSGAIFESVKGRLTETAKERQDAVLGVIQQQVTNAVLGSVLLLQDKQTPATAEAERYFDKNPEALAKLKLSTTKAKDNGQGAQAKPQAALTATPRAVITPPAPTNPAFAGASTVTRTLPPADGSNANDLRFVAERTGGETSRFANAKDAIEWVKGVSAGGHVTFPNGQKVPFVPDPKN